MSEQLCKLWWVGASGAHSACTKRTGHGTEQLDRGEESRLQSLPHRGPASLPASGSLAHYILRERLHFLVGEPRRKRALALRAARSSAQA